MLKAFECAKTKLFSLHWGFLLVVVYVNIYLFPSLCTERKGKRTQFDNLEKIQVNILKRQLERKNGNIFDLV